MCCKGRVWYAAPFFAYRTILAGLFADITGSGHNPLYRGLASGDIVEFFLQVSPRRSGNAI